MIDPEQVRRIALALEGTVDESKPDRLAFVKAGQKSGYAWTWLERVHPKKPRVPRLTVLAVRCPIGRKDILLEAAADLGSPPWRAFIDVTLPLSMPGIIAGSMLVFIPAIGEFVIPTLLGGPDNLMIGRVLWDEFFGNRDWPVASAVAIAFLVLLVGPIALYQHYSTKQLEA